MSIPRNCGSLRPLSRLNLNIASPHPYRRDSVPSAYRIFNATPATLPVQKAFFISIAYPNHRPPWTMPLTARRHFTVNPSRHVRRAVWDTARMLAVVAILLPVFFVTSWISSQEMLERDFPTPPEWSTRSRARWHIVQALQDPAVTAGSVPQWGAIASVLEGLISRIEDPRVDGNGLIPQESNLPPASAPTFLQFDLSSAFDLSSLSEVRRRAYFLAFMESAKAASALENIVIEIHTKKLYPRRAILGSANPHPPPQSPSSSQSIPMQENIVRYCPPADLFYKKLLATNGLTSAQVIQTHLAYGEWLAERGHTQQAEDIFRIALAIAVRHVPRGDDIVNLNTAIIKPQAPYITENILSSTTALAVHLASTGRVPDALPIFLADLRALRTLTLSQSDDNTTTGRSYHGTIPAQVILDGLKQKAWSLFRASEYPPAPQTGNEPMKRETSSDCKEQQLMLYAGETLFALSTKQRSTALQWIRQVLADADERAGQLSLPLDARRDCSKCLPVALQNWRAMIDVLRLEQEAGPNNSTRELPWEKEERDRWEWVKTVGRASWEEKFAFEDMRFWTWMPAFTWSKAF